MLLTLLVLLLLHNIIRALQVYDCSSTETKITEVSLKDVKECDEVPSNYNTGSLTNVQIIKKVDMHHFEALLCYVKLSLFASYCGSDSIYTYAYLSGKKLMYDKLIKISEEECLKLHKLKTITLSLSSDINLTVNLDQTEMKSGSAILKGSQDKDTSCTGENFNLDNQHFKNQILFSDYKIIVRKARAKLDSYHKQIIIEDRLTCDAEETSLFDPVAGLYVWNKKDLPNSKCDQFKEILRAEGKLYKPRIRKDEYQDILVIEDRKRSRQAALLLGDSKIICDSIGSATQFEKIFAILTNKKNPYAKIKGIEAESTSRMENLEAKIAFTYISSEMRAEEAFSKLTNALCETNRLRIKQAIRGFAEQGIGLGENQEGSIMIKAGSVAYIFACSPMEAKLRTENLVSCTNEIPITIGNSTEAFADPVSLVIMKNSTRTFCSSISPVKWAITTSNSTEWYCSTPKITRCTHPETLDPMILKTNPYQLKTSALNLDLYDKEQMKAMDRFLQISNARKSLISDFAYQLTANPGKSTGRVILDSLTSTDSESLRTLILPNTFRIFCDIWEKAKSWIVTILVLKAIFNIIMLFVRIKRLISAEGKISWRLLAAINRQIFESCISIIANNNCPCTQDEQKSCLCKNEENLEKQIRKVIAEKESMAYYHTKANELYGNECIY